MAEHFTSRAAHLFMAGTVTAALAAYGLPAWAASDNTTPVPKPKPVTESVSVTGGWENSNMARLAESSGRLLLHRIDTAENMLDSGDYQGAHNELDAAEDTAGAIRTMMPFIVVVDRIKGAKDKLLAQDAEYFHDDLLPIYSQLEEMSVYAPEVAQKAKAQVKQAEKDAAAGKVKEASKGLDKAVATITATTVYLPVDYVYDQVATARVALTGPMPDAVTARRAIENARKSLVAVATNVDQQKLG